MKILIVTQYFFPEQFRINNITESLVESGHEVDVLTGLPNYPFGKLFKGYGLCSGPYREKYQGANVIRVPLVPRGSKKSWQLILNYFSFMIIATILAPLLCRKKYDKIFVYQLSPVTSSLPAILLGKLKKIPVYFWVTDLWPETLKATNVVTSDKVLSLWGKFVTFLYKNSHRVLVTSRGFINSIESRGISREKIVYWPQWGEDIFSGSHDDTVVEILPLPDGFRIMFAGNIGTSQSFDTILDAAEKIKDIESIKWIILGDGLAADWVREEVIRRGLQETFFLLGSRPFEEMPFYYKEADVLLASLKKDPLFALTLPGKIQTYLPSGKPILVSMDGEGADLITEAGAGLACEADNSEALAQSAVKLFKMSASERKEMGKNGIHFFENNFSKELLLKDLMAIMK